MFLPVSLLTGSALASLAKGMDEALRQRRLMEQAPAEVRELEAAARDLDRRAAAISAELRPNLHR